VGNINDKLFDATDNVDNVLIIRSDKFTNNANYNNDVIFYELTSPLGSPPYYGMILPHGEDEFLIPINDMNRINKVGTVGGNRSRINRSVLLDIIKNMGYNMKQFKNVRRDKLCSFIKEQLHEIGHIV
jgi:hypothetical protein